MKLPPDGGAPAGGAPEAPAQSGGMGPDQFQAALAAERASNAAKFAELEGLRKADRARIALDEVAAGVTFADATSAKHAKMLFANTHEIEVAEGGVAIAKGASGPAELAGAFTNWLKTEGKMFVAASVQPGMGAPPSSMPQGAPQYTSIRDMPRDVFNQKLADGSFDGLRLTKDRGAPRVRLKDMEVPRMVEARNKMLGRRPPGAA